MGVLLGLKSPTALDIALRGATTWMLLNVNVQCLEIVVTDRPRALLDAHVRDPCGLNASISVSQQGGDVCEVHQHVEPWKGFELRRGLELGPYDASGFPFLAAKRRSFHVSAVCKSFTFSRQPLQLPFPLHHPP